MIHIENALANIIRRENPILSEAEIKSLVPTMQMQLQEQMAKGDLIVSFFFNWSNICFIYRGFSSPSK